MTPSRPHEFYIDLHDLLQMIKQLELRIIELEQSLDPGVKHIPPDGWYFDH